MEKYLFFLIPSVLLCILFRILLLPLRWGIDGVWVSVVVAEAMAVVLCAIFLFLKRKKYHYL